MKNSIFISLVFFFLLAGAIRLFQLGNIPGTLNRDEAALGYNAYLLLESSKDEWGESWPLFLRSFGDYKLIGYPVALLPGLSLFGLNDWVVRFPSALAGIAVLGTAWLIAKAHQLKKSETLFLVACIALQPVFIFYSRIGFEANVALFLFLTGYWALLQKHWQWDVFGLAVCFAATLTYNTPLLLLPFIVPLLIFDRGLKKVQSWILPTVGVLVISVFMFSLLLPLTEQKGNITLLSDETTWMQWIEYRTGLPAWQQPVIGNRYLYILGLMITNTLKSFSPSFLVTSGGAHPWHTLPGYGHILIPIYILMIVGLGNLAWKFTKLKWSKTALKVVGQSISRAEWHFLYLLPVALLPAVITVDAPHATRSLLFFVLLCFWAAKGFVVGQQIVQKKFPKLKLVYLCVVGILVAVTSGQYLIAYFSWTPREQASWRPGIKEITQTLKKSTDKVAWVDEDGYSYILVAWYDQIPADLFLRSIIHQLPNSFGFNYGQQVGKYHFIGQASDKIDSEKDLVYWDQESTAWRIKEE